MVEPDFQETIEVLSQETAREVLKILDNDTKSVREVFEEIQNTSKSLKYRESVYKVLENLTEVGLVKKIREGNSVRYRSKYYAIQADLLEEKLKLERGDSDEI